MTNSISGLSDCEELVGITDRRWWGWVLRVFKSIFYALGWNWIADFGFSGGFGCSYIAVEPPSVEIKIIETPEGQEVSDADIEKHRQTLINESSNITFIVWAIGWNF